MKTTKTIAKIAGAVLAGMMALSFASCNEKGGSANVEKLKAGKPAAEADFEIKLTDDGNGVIITKYKGTDKNLVIPSTIQGSPVVGIDGNYNMGNIFNESPVKEKVQSVVVPEGVIFIFCGFGSSPNLSTVVLPSTLKKIGGFGGCKKLTSITLPDGLKVIGRGAFSHSGLTSINLPEGLEFISQEAFENTPLTSVTLPKSLKFLGYSAFKGCDNLSEIHFPEEMAVTCFCEGWLNGSSGGNAKFTDVFGGEKIEESVALQKLLKDAKSVRLTSDEISEVIK